MGSSVTDQDDVEVAEPLAWARKDLIFPQQRTVIHESHFAFVWATHKTRVERPRTVLLTLALLSLLSRSLLDDFEP
jgi:hypothetical protein